MKIKKTGKTIFGADLTAAERKALEMELRHQLKEFDKKHMMELDAMLLWGLHEEYDFGAKRLRRMFEKFHEHMEALLERYDMEETDSVWLCTEKLKSIGVDLAAWYQEIYGNEKG